jgi:hypothetical protein
MHTRSIIHVIFSLSVTVNTTTMSDSQRRDIALSRKLGLFLRRSNDPLAADRPTVILVAFLGCTPRISSKLVDVYVSAGYNVIYLCPSAFALFCFTYGHHYANRVLKVVVKALGHKAPVVFALFSNNGTVFYNNCMQQMYENKNLELDVRGCVWDCCPGQLILDRGANALRIAMGAGPVGAFFIRLALLLFLYVKLILPRECDGTYGYWRNMCTPDKKHGSHVKDHLFLYAGNDKLVDREWVEEAIKSRRSMGMTVHAHCYEDADHCALVRTHGPDYQARIARFVEHLHPNTTKEDIANRIQ